MRLFLRKNKFLFSQFCAKVRKITLITAIVLLSAISPVLSQYYNSEYNTFVGGVVGGVNFTQVDGDGYKGYNKAGFNFGGIVYIPFGEMDMPVEGTLALSMEVLYTEKGSYGNSPIFGIVSQKIKLQYAEVPIQLNFYRGSRKSGFGTGLSIGYLAKEEELLDMGNGTILRNEFPFRKFDLSFILTGNIHIYKGIFISPRFQYSLISVRKNAGGFGRNEQFNNVFALRLMYLFKRKGEN